MFHIKKSIVTSLTIFAFIASSFAFAKNEDTNPLTGRVETNRNVDDANAIKIRSSVGDAAAGRDRSQLCQGCHGEDGNSVEPLAPKLAGQYSDYIVKQVRNYQAGTRTHQIMNAMAATLTDEELINIGNYFASRTTMKGDGSGNNPVGKNLFLKGDIKRMVIGCVNCHGVNGKGLTPFTSTFPVLGGQHKAYIAKQLQDFRSGLRSNSAGNIMVKIATQLTDAEIDALASYVSGL
ncbi:MAG: c-type cytochrome [Gallionella sp.]|nr:cytochrome c4 [Gallionella sp.]